MTTLVVTTVAPSLGKVGSVGRVACATLVLVATAHAVLTDKVSADGGGVHLRPSQIGACLVFVGSLAGAAMSPVGAAYGFSRLLNWLLFAPLLVLFCRRPRFSALAIGALLVGALQIVGVVMQARGLMTGVWGGAIISGSGYNRLTSTWLVRYTGFVRDPNNLAVLMNLAALAGLSVLWSTKRRALRLVMITAVLAAVGTIVASGSRGGLLALPLGLLLFAIFAGAKVLIRVAAAASVATYLAITAQWRPLEGLLMTLTDATSGRDQSLTQRFATWERYNSEGHHWLIGQGFGGYNQTALAGSGFDVAQEAARQATVDNSWLKLLLEAGLLGVAGATALLCTACLALVRARSRASGPVIGAVAAALLVIVWRSMSTDALDINPYNAIAPLLVGAAYALGHPSKHWRVETSPRQADFLRSRWRAGSG